MSIVKLLGIVLFVGVSSSSWAMRVPRKPHPSVYALRAGQSAGIHTRVPPAPAKQLPEAVYQMCTRVIEKETYDTHQPFPQDWKKYCQIRVQNLKQLQQKAIGLDHALAGLDSLEIKLRELNMLGIANCVTFAYAFAHRSEWLLLRRVNLVLGAYAGKLEDFEQSYVPPLEQVTMDEYKKRVNEIGQGCLKSLHVEESARLAEHMLVHSVEAKL